MTDLDALLRAVLDHPDDDTPRLIYADALALFAAHPVEDLELRVARPVDARPLGECRWLGRLTRLTIEQGLGAQVARRLFESRHFERLTGLTVGAPMSTPATTRAVVRS